MNTEINTGMSFFVESEQQKYDIVVKPLSREYILNNLFLFLLFGVSAVIPLLNFDYYIRAGALAVFVGLFCLLFINWFVMLSYSWTITREQIVYKRGLLQKKIDFIELYRVIDFSESQNLLQQIFQTKTIVITSGDKSHPELKIFGVRFNNNLIRIIRERVEINKKNKRIYEVTNQ